MNFPHILQTRKQAQGGLGAEVGELLLKLTQKPAESDSTDRASKPQSQCFGELPRWLLLPGVPSS